LPALDGVRAIAVGLVVLFHTDYGQELMPGGAVGVDLFFILSGFLITLLLLRESQVRGRISIPGFYRRRILRILPVFIVVLVCYIGAALVASSGAQQREMLSAAVRAGLYFSNLYAAAGHSLQVGIALAWSLAVEEQFYLVWPLLLTGLLLFGNRRAVMMGTLVIAVGSTLERVTLLAGGTPWYRLYYAPDIRAAELAAGACAAALLVYHRESVAWLARHTDLLGLIAAGLLVAMSVFAAPQRSLLYTAGATLLIVAVPLFLTASSLGEGSKSSRLLTTRPFRWIGLISYSLYFWSGEAFLLVHLHHGSLRRIEYTPLAILLGLLLASISYYVVERPFLRLKDRGRREVKAAG
jgi:peptidoglycan/LPS O-acetylase OafA/YrhL